MYWNQDDIDDDTYRDDDADDDAISEALLLCGRGSDGYCTQAGTEYCDGECPFNE